MTALLAWLLSNPTILAIGAAIVGALGFGFQQRLAGVKAERNAQKAKEADAYEKHLQDIQAAASARPSGSVLNDPHNRDR
jgi:hypothetical protein